MDRERRHSGLMVTGLVAPLGLFWFGRGPLGRQARRRRVRVIAISAFLIPLMAIGPESVLALHDQAALYQAVAAAAIGQTVPTAITYTYDENGNLTRRTAGSATDTYVYDRQNRLVSADLQIDGVRCLSFGYDADGIRNRRTVNGQTTFHLVDPNQPYAQVLAEHDGEGEVSVRYAYGLDLLTQTRGTNTWYYHYDGQLSTRLLTDSAGLPVSGHDAYTYDAFGNLLSGSPDSNNSYLYTGEQLDPDLGFYYLRARHYAPSIGRFTTQDPYSGSPAEPKSLHKYLYVHADPINAIDPTGLFTLVELNVNMVIRSALMYALHTITEPAERYVFGSVFNAVVPAYIAEHLKLATFANISALMIGYNAGYTQKLPYQFGVGAGGGLELLVSPRTYNWGLYAFAEVNVSFRGGLGLGESVKGGIVFNASTLGDYTKEFRSITVGWRWVPRPWRKLLTQKVRMLRPPPGEPIGASRPSFASRIPKDVWRKGRSVLRDIFTRIENKAVTIFWTPGKVGAFGISIESMDLEDGSSGISTGWQYYWLLAGEREDPLK